MPSALSSFQESLEAVGVSVAVATPETFPDQVQEAVDAPAVGAPLDAALDHDALSLVDTDVDVDPSPAALQAATTGVTGATLEVAADDTLVLSLADRNSELVSLFVDRYVVVLRAADVRAHADAADDAIHVEFDREGGGALLSTRQSATDDAAEPRRGPDGPGDVHVVVVE